MSTEMFSSSGAQYGTISLAGDDSSSWNSSPSSSTKWMTGRKIALVVGIIFLVGVVGTIGVLRNARFSDANPTAVVAGNILRQWKCPAGSHPVGRNAAGMCICKLCPAGSRCKGGYNGAIRCSPGTYQPRTGQSACIPASPGYKVPARGMKMQIKCAPGQYQPKRGQSVCRRPKPGYYVSKNGSARVVPCPAGWYQPAAGKNFCIQARAGYFANKPGCAAAKPCPAGWYQPKKGSKKCLKAQPGYFVPGKGSKKQWICHYGQYQPKAGSSKCRNARAGYFVAKQGAKKEVPCPKNTYQHCVGQMQCISCRPGFHQPKIGQAKCIIRPVGGAGAAATTTTTTAAPNGGLSLSLINNAPQVSSSAVVCVSVPEHRTATVTCPKGVIKQIQFASYGTPTGKCKGFAKSSCNAATSIGKVKAACLNKPTCNIKAKNSVFGDPCRGTLKKLNIQALCQ